MGLFTAALRGGRRKYVGKSTLAEPSLFVGGIAPWVQDPHRTIRASFQAVSSASPALKKRKPLLIQNVSQAATELGFQPKNGCCKNRYRDCFFMPFCFCFSLSGASRGLLGCLWPSPDAILAMAQTQTHFWPQWGDLAPSYCFQDSRWFANDLQEVICKVVTEGCCEHGQGCGSEAGAVAVSVGWGMGGPGSVGLLPTQNPGLGGI